MPGQNHVEREVLPIPDRKHIGYTTYDARSPDTTYPDISPLVPPEGAPNVLLVLLDDVGFGAGSAFGGPVHMPTAERLAAGGLKYTRFHTTALCSPTRAALLSGRNHHTVGMGNITELATSAPGQSSVRPNDCAPLPEVLKLNGYSTAHFGKCHEVPVWETSQAGPFDRWPTGNGFEHFYGFIGGETNQWYPDVVEGTKPVEPWGTPEEGYHLMPDLADKAIEWIRQQQTLSQGKPFFCYFAPGATHAPHHVPMEWAEKYKGRFAAGWDAIREETYRRQKELGVIPQDAELTMRHEEIPAWDTMDPQLKPVLERQMEIYAGFLEYADHHVGRLIEAIESIGVLDNTLIYYIIGDNGASAEGSLQGTLNELTMAEAPGIETPKYLIDNLDKFGGPEAYNHYAVGWAHAMCTPYQWTKQVASHWGGTRNSTIVHWPAGIRSKGEMRHQFHHVIDVAPTILEVAKLPQPSMVHGLSQEPIQGFSMLYSFDDANAPETHQSQYFEMFCNRGIYHRGWSAVTIHRVPWNIHEFKPVPFDEDVWELYDGSGDWTQAHNLAGEMPEKLAELQRLFLIEAAKYNVLPLDDRVVERVNPDMAGRPVLIRGNTQLLYAGMIGIQENCMLNLKNKSHSVTAEVEVGDGGVRGVIVNEGGTTGGWVLYAGDDGRLKYDYNFLGVEHTNVAGEPLPAGKHQVRMEFAYDGGGVGKGGEVRLYVDGQQTGSGRVQRTHGYNYSLCETGGVGRDQGSPVCRDYSPTDNRFSGKIDWVRLDIGGDDHSHMLDQAQQLHFAMSKQ